MKITVAFNPERYGDNRYNYLFNNLKREGAEVIIKPVSSSMLDNNTGFFSELCSLLEEYKKDFTESNMVFYLSDQAYLNSFADYKTRFNNWVNKIMKNNAWPLKVKQELEMRLKDYENIIGLFAEHFQAYLRLPGMCGLIEKEYVAPLQAIRVMGLMPFENAEKSKIMINNLNLLNQKSIKIKELMSRLSIEDLIINVKCEDNKDLVLSAGGFVKIPIIMYEVLKENNIPLAFKSDLNNFINNRFFPAVFKLSGSSRGQGINYIEEEKDFKKFLRFACQSVENYRYKFLVSRFIESPSDYYTHYRIFTLGSGKVLASALSYSSNKKCEGVKNVFGFNKIVSNVGSGGSQIPLNPNEKSKELCVEEERILEAHNISNQALPDALRILAEKAAVALGEKGMYITGQDWIQDLEGNYYCLESNSSPNFMVFDALYNYGKRELEESIRIGSEKIAEGIIGHLKQA